MVPRFAFRRDAGALARRKDGRQGSGAEPGEQIDQRVENGEQREANLGCQHPHEPALVTVRHDALAHVVEGTLQTVGGVKREGVTHAWFL